MNSRPLRRGVIKRTLSVLLSSLILLSSAVFVSAAEPPFEYYYVQTREGMCLDSGDQLLFNIEPGTSPEYLTVSLASFFASYSFEVYKESLYEGKVCTGTQVKISDGSGNSMFVTAVVIGDKEGTGKATPDCARSALRLAAALDKASVIEDFLVCDANNDSKVTADDARAILRCAASLDKARPSSGGSSQTPDPPEQQPSALKFNPPSDTGATATERLVNSQKLVPTDVVQVVSNRDDVRPFKINISDADKKTMDAVITECCKAEMSNYERLQAIYKYIQGSFSYAYGSLWDEIDGLSPVDAIINHHLGQCYQYNACMAEFFNYLGYESRVVAGYRCNRSGTSRWSHFWTELMLDGTPYLVEVGEPENNWYGWFIVTYENSDNRYVR